MTASEYGSFRNQTLLDKRRMGENMYHRIKLRKFDGLGLSKKQYLLCQCARVLVFRDVPCLHVTNCHDHCCNLSISVTYWQMVFISSFCQACNVCEGPQSINTIAQSQRHMGNMSYTTFCQRKKRLCLYFCIACNMETEMWLKSFKEVLSAIISSIDLQCIYTMYRIAEA